MPDMEQEKTGSSRESWLPSLEDQVKQQQMSALNLNVRDPSDDEVNVYRKARVRKDLSNGLIMPSSMHYSIQHMGRHFAYGHLPEELQGVSMRFAQLAQFLVDSCLYGPELTESLRKLWEAKNSAVLHAGYLHGLRQDFSSNYADRIEELMDNFEPETMNKQYRK